MQICAGFASFKMYTHGFDFTDRCKGINDSGAECVDYFLHGWNGVCIGKHDLHLCFSFFHYVFITYLLS